MKTLLLFVSSFISISLPLCSAQTVVSPKGLTFSADATVAVNVWMVQRIASTPTTVAVAIDNKPSTTTATLVDASSIATPAEIVIDGEAFNVASKVGNVITFTRSDLGTLPIAHLVGAQVGVLQYKSFADFCFQVVSAAVKSIIDQDNASPTIAAQKAAIATAQAAIAAAKTAAVQ